MSRGGGKTVDQVYAERSLFAIALAVMIDQSDEFKFHTAGYDVETHNWPIVWMHVPGATPSNIGVHVHPCYLGLLEASPLREAKNHSYDGHGRVDRINRLTESIEDPAECL